MSSSGWTDARLAAQDRGWDATRARNQSRALRSALDDARYERLGLQPGSRMRRDEAARVASVAQVASMYGSLASLIGWRFEPQEHEAGWWPRSDRFPRAAL